MIKLIALLIIASGCVFGQEAEPQAAGERWEYCVAESTAFASFRDGKYEARVRICYASERGCREETVVVSEEAAERFQRRYVEDEADSVIDRAFAKTLASLGKERWELVGVVEAPYPTDGRPLTRGKSLYFKRRAR
jgi:hypothetical protein